MKKLLAVVICIVMVTGIFASALPAFAAIADAQMIKFNADVFQLNNGVLTASGWAGANYPANNLGYRIDGGEAELDGVEFANFNTPAEGDTIRTLAGENAFRFKTRTGGIALDLTPGEHTIALVVRVVNGTDTEILDMGSKKFTVAAEPDPAQLVAMSFNTVWVDGTQVCDVGDASAFLKDNPIVDASSVGFRGWAYITNSTIESMGYRIDDGDPVVNAGWIQDRADVRAALGGLDASVCNGYDVRPIDVSGLAAGDHTITVVVKAADGNYVDVVAVPVTVSAPAAPEPALVAQNLDYWAHYHAGFDCAAVAVFDVGQYDGFHTYGWVGFNYEVSRIGYRLNGVEYFPETITVTEGNDAVKEAGGEFAVRYDMIGSFEGAVVGVNELVWIAELEDENSTVMDFFGPYNFTCTEVGGTVHPQSTLFTATHPTEVSGWWTGPVVGLPVGGVIDFKLTAPWAFDGICLMMYASNATMEIRLYNENGIQVDGANATWATDGVVTAYFTRAHAPGTYTIEFIFVDGGYFVFAAGTPSGIPVEVSMSGFIGNANTLQAPVAFLTGANNPGQPKAPTCLNAAYDDLHFDDTVLCSSKAYTWVADPANQEALTFEKTSVEEIYMRGWAYIDKDIYSFGYRIDGGDIVYDDAFIDDRAQELADAGFPGAQGFAVTVPVEKLSSGEHTIEVIVIDEDGMFTPVVKVKNEVEYPVGVTVTVTKLQDHESVLTNKNFDRYYVEGVELGQGGTGAYAGNVHTNIINKYPQAYAKTGNDEITITGWAGFDGEYVETFGYKIDDQPSVTSPAFVTNRNAELAGAGFPYGEGFSISFGYGSLEPGEHTVTLFATALDEVEYELITYTFTVSEVGAWLFDPAQGDATIGDGIGWWTGKNVSPTYVNGDVSIEFESPISFDGVYTIYWANSVPGAVMDINLYDENDELLDTVTAAFMFNGRLAYKFNKVFPAGTYTLQYLFVEDQASHFVLGAGAHSDIDTFVYGECNNSGNDTYGPAVGLLYAELPPVVTTCDNAAFDELKYDDTALVSSKAYTWVADPANQEAMNFEEGAVSNIFFKGWAQLSTAITGFGYVIDDGEPVVDAAFIVDRAAELEDAGYPGAQGFGVTVPVADLAVGEHSIKIVAIDANDEPVGIIKVKNEVVYPVAITFTVSEAAVVNPAQLIKATFDLFDLNNGALTVQGWAGANYPANNLGYKIDDGEVIFDGIEFANFNTPAEGETIKSLAGPDAFRFKTRDGALPLNLEAGEHTITIVMRVSDGTNNYVVEMGSKDFTVTGQPDPAKLVLMSFNTIWVDGAQICDVGDALTFCPLEGKLSAIGLRGWAYITNSTIEGMGYRIDDGEPVIDAGYIQDRADVRAALGGVSADVANGFMVSPIDVSGLANGEHTITIVVKAADGNYVDVVAVPVVIRSEIVMQEFNWYALDGVVLSSAGNVDQLVKDQKPTYLLGNYNEIGFLGKVALAGNEPISAFGYSVDGGEIVTKDVFFSRIFNEAFDYTAELTAAGYPNGEGFWIVMNYDDLAAGEHTLTYYVMASDGTPIEMMSYDFTVAEVIWLYNKAGGYSTGFWTGPNCGKPTGNICIEFTTEEAFNGVYQIFYADYADCLVDINLYDEDENLLETINAHFYDNSRSIEYFENVYPAGSYILEYQYVGEVGHFVLGSGNASDVEVAMYGDYGTNESTFAAPTVALIIVNEEEPAACLNAAFDDLWYDEIKLCEAKAYMWVVEHADDLDFEAGTVSQIYFRGWAQLNKPIAGFGYVIDDGEVVSDPTFIQDRAAELEGAGFPGGQGYAIWVPVDDLAAGEHTIKIVAISEDEDVVEIFKTKNDVDYPVAITFEIIAPIPATELLQAAFDELKYDDTALVSSKAYMWVADEANKAALNFKEGEVSAISFKGWAQLNKPIAGFGYVIDDGEVVKGEFIDERGAELEAAGFPGAQGFLVVVPVADLAAGEHTIKIVALDEEDAAIDIVKIKESVTYPVAITFTVAAGEAQHEFLPGDANMDGERDNKDVVVLFRYVSGTEKAEDEYVYDFDGDGEVNNKDVVGLFRFLSTQE